MRDLQRYTLIPVGQDEPDAYLELDPDGPWVLYRDVALSTPAHSVTPDPQAARETLRPDPLTPEEMSDLSVLYSRATDQQRRLLSGIAALRAATTDPAEPLDDLLACRHGYVIGTMCSECPEDIARLAETLRPDPLTPDHHDISWFGASGDVACIHDAEREGCTGCAHDADLRTTTHADTSGLPETALAAATERPLDVADHKHPRHEWRGHSSHMHEHHGDNIVWFPEAPTATPEAEDA